MNRFIKTPTPPSSVPSLPPSKLDRVSREAERSISAEVETADSEAGTASASGAGAEEATAEEVAAVIGTMAEAQEEESVHAGALQVNGTELAG